MIYINGKKASRLYAGGKEVKTAYSGGKKIFGKGGDTPIGPQPQTGDFGTLKWTIDGVVKEQPLTTYSDFCALSTTADTHDFGIFSFTPYPKSHNDEHQTALSYYFGAAQINCIPDRFLSDSDVSYITFESTAYQPPIYDIGNYCFNNLPQLKKFNVFSGGNGTNQKISKIGNNCFNNYPLCTFFTAYFPVCKTIGDDCFNNMPQIDGMTGSDFSRVETIGTPLSSSVSFSLFPRWNYSYLKFQSLKEINGFGAFMYFGYDRDTSQFIGRSAILSFPKLVKFPPLFCSYCSFLELEIGDNINVADLPSMNFCNQCRFDDSFKFSFTNADYGVLGIIDGMERSMFQMCVLADPKKDIYEFEFNTLPQTNSPNANSFTQQTDPVKTFNLSGTMKNRVASLLPNIPPATPTPPWRTWNIV